MANMIYFWKSGAFTQFCPARFSMVLDGQKVDFLNAEQAMMYRKAKLFGDETAAKAILQEYNPMAIKKIGRTVKGFDQAKWEKERETIVYENNLAKFTQNPQLKGQLAATGNKILVEASPYDKIWGIGLKEGDPGYDNPDQWKGRNLLGKILMKVRETLRSD